MRLTWQIQKRRESTHAKSLTSQGPFDLNENSTVYPLVQKHRLNRSASKTDKNGLRLFNF